MIDQSKCLPPSLIKLLTLPDSLIENTALTFLSHVSNVASEDRTAFIRALQVSNTLGQLGKQLQTYGIHNGGFLRDAEVGSLQFEFDHDGGAASVRLNEEELLAFFLNGEFVFVMLYEQHGLRKNSFLIHWIESYQQLLNLYLGEEDDEGHPRSNDTTTKNELCMRLVKVRAAFIGAILNGVTEIGNCTPRSYACDFSHYPVDINSFNSTLIEQMIYDTLEDIPWYQAKPMNGGLAHQETQETVSSGTWSSGSHASSSHRGSVGSRTRSSVESHEQSPPPGFPDHPSYIDIPAAQQVLQPRSAGGNGSVRAGSADYSPICVAQQQARNEAVLLEKLYSYIQKAQADEIPNSDVVLLLKHFEEYPPHLLAVFSPTEEALTNLVTVNPRLAKSLVQLYLLSASPGSLERKEMLLCLPRLPVSLQVLELINQLVISSMNATHLVTTPPLSANSTNSQSMLSKHEIDLLLHTYLANAMLKAESIGGIADGTLQSRQGRFSSTYGGIGNLAGGAASQHAKNMQQRMVQLLCLFVQALINNGIIRLEEYYYEVQELGVRYIFVKEARELWQKVNPGALGR